MSSCWLMFPEARRFLVFSSSGFKPPASGFSLILRVASRLLHPYSTDGKTSRLMVKRFSTVRDSQRGSQSCMEKRRRRRGDRGDQEEKRGNEKRREKSSQ